MKTTMKMLMMFTIIGAILFAGVSVGGKAPPEKAKTEIAKTPEPPEIAVTETVAPVIVEPPGTTVAAEKEKENATTWLEKIYLFLGSVVGITILRFLLRYIPTTVNIDLIGWIVKIINLIYGAWIENRKVSGGTFNRNYSK